MVVFLLFLASIPLFPVFVVPLLLLFPTAPICINIQSSFFFLIQEAIFAPMLGLFIQSLSLKQIANCASSPTDFGQRGNKLGLFSARVPQGHTPG